MVKIKNNLINLVALVLLLIPAAVLTENNGNYSSREDVSNFIEEMNVKHGFDKDKLLNLFPVQNSKKESFVLWTGSQKVP